ncbi:hypothetical protein HYH03_006870 [Edaphochlamys debaryana]|uniref:Uncharacterized protein n=1 Tax=Edaphochlamys debaryana TaxID=47281 RepID=A0A836BZR3_9CHLO|nr:hypothetical protein HYH03_006870 [Edaphochlamys debaryana]|eukprot:KAG2494935.1 hypothetical protein HYH03_006870 [Edaphochlamys debaryana]
MMARLFCRALLLQQLLCILEVSQAVVTPVLLRYFLQWLEAAQAGEATSSTQWHGWLLAAALGASGTALCFFHHHHSWLGAKTALLMRKDVISRIYAKALRLTGPSLAAASAEGAVATLISTDVRRLDDSLPLWPYLLAAPLQLMAVLAMVTLELDWVSALAGVATSLALIPLQGLLASRIAALSARSGALQVSSVFYALSLLQLPTAFLVDWFVVAVQNVTELRVSVRRIDAFLSTPEPPCMPGQANSSCGGPEASDPHHQTQDPAGADPHGADPHGPPPVPVGTVRMGGAAYAWPSVQPSSFKMTGPTPDADTGSSAPLSSKLRKLLSSRVETASAACSETDTEPVSDSDSATTWRRWSKDSQGEVDAVGTVTIVVDSEVPRLKVADSDDGSSSDIVSPAAAPSLAGVAFALAPGELLCVTGATGSGKTSLLAALMGELPATAGTGGGSVGEAAVYGSVAYCAQLPWVMAGTARDNILLGLPYDEEWYGRVVQACCLMDDFVSWAPDGDGIELGDGGTNISGGQRARLALARACYARPSVALLDDPLSAVDPRVARCLFDGVIGPGGLLAEAGATRVLVTHQQRFLAGAGQVLVLRAGRQVALGPWEAVSGLGLPELGSSRSAQVSSDGRAAEPVYENCNDERPEVERPDAKDSAVETEAPKALVQGGRPRPQPLRPQRSMPQRSMPQRSMRTVLLDSGRPTPTPEAFERRVRASLDLPRRNSADVQATGRPPLAEVRAWGRTLSRSVDYGYTRPPPLPGSGLLSAASIGRAAGAAGGSAAAFASRKKVLNWSKSGRRLVVSEDRAEGGVSWGVYASYGRYLGGVPLLCVLCVGLLGGQALALAADWWLAEWAHASEEEQADKRWLAVYGALTGAVVAIALFRAALFFAAAIAASTKIHNSMIERVLRSPLSFFHTNPTGRILNRFSRDQGIADDLLPTYAFDSLQCAGMVLGAFVLVAAAVPLVLPVLVLLAALFYYIRRRYLTASRQIKRWEAVTYTPVCSTIVSTLKGLPTIRAYRAGPLFEAQLQQHLALHSSWWFALIASQRWVGLRMDMLASLALVATALLACALQKRISIEVLGLALTHTLNLATLMQWFVRQSAELENSMTSVERMVAYTQLPTEPQEPTQQGGKAVAAIRAAAGQPGRKSHDSAEQGEAGVAVTAVGARPADWPRTGALRYENVSAVYRAGLHPVLRDLTFELHPGSSCGVVGRTGSGKSSLVLTLFRLIHVTHGRILLDGVDIASVPLALLRRHLAIIPQDPTLFSGTLRSNLDSQGAHADGRVWEVLRSVGLREAVAAMPGGLDALVACGGVNLSVGQRQQLCLARALLTGSKLLALDEATANVDAATDAAIQATLREFASGGADSSCRVVLTIAHRLETVMGADQLLVLGGGVLLESGPPGTLAEAGGAFSEMVEAARQQAEETETVA